MLAEAGVAAHHPSRVIALNTGVRFVVNGTCGISKLPYRRFVTWATVGGTIWSAYTCVLAHEVGIAGRLTAPPAGPVMTSCAAG